MTEPDREVPPGTSWSEDGGTLRLPPGGHPAPPDLGRAHGWYAPSARREPPPHMIIPAPPETPDTWDDRQRAARGTGTVFLTFLGPSDDETHAAGYWDAHPEHPDGPPLAQVVRHRWSDALAWAADRTGRIVVSTPTGGPYTAGAVRLPGREPLPDAFR